jgi:hypothetical protein
MYQPLRFLDIFPDAVKTSLAGLNFLEYRVAKNLLRGKAGHFSGPHNIGGDFRQPIQGVATVTNHS